MHNRIRKIILFFLDAGMIILSLFFSFMLRFEWKIPVEYIGQLKETVFPVVLIILACFYIFNLYDRLWRYASINELISIVLATFFGTFSVLFYTFITGNMYPRSIYILFWLLLTAVVGGGRFILRSYSTVIPSFKKVNGTKNIMVIGAGEAGSMVIEEFIKHPELKMRPVAIIDDDSRKHGMMIHGIKVEGGRRDILEVALRKNVHEIVIAMPSIDRKEIKDIVQICRKTECRLKILPGVYELLDGKVSIKRLRDVNIEDLLGREPVKVDLEEVSGYIKDKMVLVTGGGGSIGSELCRQIAAFNPKSLLIFDINENNIYDLEYDLKVSYPDLKYMALIGDIKDVSRVNYVFERYKPDVVFHAAAHKHVPLMELNPTEAIKNNVFGTLNVAEAADKYGTERFILISTDKAVNPVNIMGASKRIAEIIIQMMAKKSSTIFAAVRFGNVLGSNGSVVPLFKKQIQMGGPVTVTHPDVTRYFMTIPEAVQLVIQAGSMASGGEIFVLDMGEPVKIVDLAREMIKLSGLEPDVDVKIQFTGLRPGEKLFEELLLKEEGFSATKYKKIYIAKPAMNDVSAFLKELNDLKEILFSPDYGKLEKAVKRLVPNYSSDKRQSDWVNVKEAPNNEDFSFEAGYN
ncbi:MAG: polysaccharide biosynthesis protein [Tepidanaerobacteraceae bacterium]|jgi:FlaA1/EpsC-like NDP-sugar epimerase|nr:polysaccharide biosynthesis protein [Tepidanaerobacteraceae bacterium]